MPGIIRMKTSSVSPFHFSIAISKRLDPGSMPGMTRYIDWGYLFRGWRPPSTRHHDTTWSCHLSTFRYPADPVDPVIRVLFPFHLSTA